MSLTKPKFLKIEAEVRYLEDATISGVESESGDAVPFKVGNYFCPLIDLDDGRVIDWPAGMVADFHFKVCDSGSYYLFNEDMIEVGSIIQNYVPSGVCHGDNGFGDYIIFSVDESGKIIGYENGIDELEFEQE